MLTLTELVLNSEPDAAARARRAVDVALPDADPELLDAARLVVTELVTNAQLHGAAPISVRVGSESDQSGWRSRTAAGSGSCSRAAARGP